ncbi:carbamoyl-phosphate synthase large subunit [soil metagenome]
MPKRSDIKSILIIGAGPIVIGQAAEFDYSGSQAVKALKAEGYRVIVVNSNPATIMTDPELADATYIEPITPGFVASIIEKERPDALLPTMGGQTALNTALALAKNGTLERFAVELIGANAEAIEKAEDRLKFREAMTKIGLESPISAIAHSMDDALAALEKVGLPAIIRPSFTLGGTGGGIAYNREEFEAIVSGGLEASPTSEVLIEESVLGWKEYEMEVVRDKADNAIIICSIENIDPMGVHTGDSITVAPALTLTDKEYQRMRSASIAVLREIGVETGGSNVQFAVDPKTGRMVVIEMNPRVSRSSALASKATGFPIAKVAAKLAVGYTLEEISNDITGGATPASFEPTIDYVVTKIPRFTFEKFKGAEALLSTSMKSVGEVMAIGRSFPESLQKALRGLETGLTGLDRVRELEDAPADRIENALGRATPDRLLVAAEALRQGFSVERINAISGFDPWFLNQLAVIVEAENEVRDEGLPSDVAGMRRLKSLGFSYARLAQLSVLSAHAAGKAARGVVHDALKHMTGGVTEAEVRAHRLKLGVRPVFKRIDSCAAEFDATTPYMYSTYEAPLFSSANTLGEPVDEAEVSDRKKVMILGGGPNRIGQGIEFDYCCCHAAFALGRDGVGLETIMVNCNPETVSTDPETSDRLYFEPLTVEDVLEIVEREKSRGELIGVIVQLGGQTPLRLAGELQSAGVPILGTSPDSIDLAEDRERFAKLVARLGLKQPANGIARSPEEALMVAERIGYPVLLRPSYVLGGRGMEVVDGPDQLNHYIATAVAVSGTSPVLIDRYLRDAVEVDVDAICDGTDVIVTGVMQHIEEAGVHSGDSACVIPPHSLPPAVVEEIERQTAALAQALKVKGLMNVQFAVKEGAVGCAADVYLIEVNPRASRTVPFVAKAIGRPVAKIAARVMAGEKLSSFDPIGRELGHIAVKEPVFPFARFPGCDPVLGPEMRSTGEVMGIDRDFDAAFSKALIASGIQLPQSGTVFVSVKDSDKAHIVPAVEAVLELGFAVIATDGTAEYLKSAGLEVTAVNKVAQGRPHIVDKLTDGEVQLVFNTTEGWQSLKDSHSIRATALHRKVPYFTTAAASLAVARSLGALQGRALEVHSLQSDYSASDN